MNGEDDKFRSRKWILTKALVLISVIQSNIVLAASVFLMKMEYVPRATESWSQSLMFGLGFMGVVLGWAATAYLGANVAEKGWMNWIQMKNGK